MYVIMQCLDCPSCTYVFRMLWLRDVGVRDVDLADEREDPDAIINCGYRTPLGHTFLDVQEISRPLTLISKTLNHNIINNSLTCYSNNNSDV